MHVNQARAGTRPDAVDRDTDNDGAATFRGLSAQDDTIGFFAVPAVARGSTQAEWGRWRQAMTSSPVKNFFRSGDIFQFAVTYLALVGMFASALLLMNLVVAIHLLGGVQPALP
jgi:hypothetical protein